MASRVHALELKEMQQSSSYPPDAANEVNPSACVNPDEHSHGVRNVIPDGMISSYWEELERSRVYRKTADNRGSIFSTDQCTLASSYLSTFSVDQVSSISIINLVITSQEVHNPQRLAQSWSNDRPKLLHSLNLPSGSEGSFETRVSREVQAEHHGSFAPLEMEASSIDTARENSCQIDSIEHCSVANAMSSSASKVLYMRALYDFTSVERHGRRVELELQKGDIVAVIQQLDSGWWDGIVNGIRGLFPSNYCEIIAEPEASNEFDRWPQLASGGSSLDTIDLEKEIKRMSRSSTPNATAERLLLDNGEIMDQDNNKNPGSPGIDRQGPTSQTHHSSSDAGKFVHRLRFFLNEDLEITRCTGCGGLCGFRKKSLQDLLVGNNAGECVSNFGYLTLARKADRFIVYFVSARSKFPLDIIYYQSGDETASVV